MKSSENKGYQDFFEKIKKFKEEQNQQKQRGLNNYNILTSVLNKSDEVRLHTRMIYSFLNPHGTHYQSTLFLDKFLEILDIDDFTINAVDCRVYKEYQNIDLYITDGTKHIILENKVYASDQKNQIKRYIEIIQDENEDLDVSDILVVYLSLNRLEPSSYSLGNLEVKGDFIQKKFEKITQFKSIHYKNEILKWLNKCRYEVQNITNLNEVFKQYIDVVKMINNQYRDSVMNLSDYIKDDIEVYKIAHEIQKALPDTRKSIVDEFFNKVTLLLKEELGSDWTVKVDGTLSKRHSFPFKIYKNNWDIGNKLLFGFEFHKNDYYNGCFGIVRQNNRIMIKNQITSKYKVELDNLDLKLRTTQWWLHWEKLPSKINDFTEYVLFTDNVEEEFVNKIIALVKIFEIDSNLMTDINDYLKLEMK